MEVKLYATKRSMDNWRNQRGKNKNKNKNKKNKKQHLETNESTVVQNLWDTAKAVLRGKVIAIQILSQETRKIQK